MMNRRKMLQRMAAGAGAAFGSSRLPGLAGGTAKAAGAPKRVIFFMQNQGFEPGTSIPAGMSASGSLAKAVLPEPIKALEPFKERLHIINGLHGRHTSPSHSAFFGALGGYRGSDGVPVGSVYVHTVIDTQGESRLVVKVGAVRFGSNASPHSGREKSFFSDDFCRFRVRWTELQLVLNEVGGS